MKDQTPSPWLKPLEAKVLGGLRPLMNQFSDGTTTHLTPKKLPRKSVHGTGQLVALPPPPPDICIPVVVDSVVPSPDKNPYDLGDEVTFSLGGLSGSPVIRYQWFLNYVPVSTAATYVHTMVNSDVKNKDGAGLGVAYIFCIVYNDCGMDYTDALGAVPVQGTP